MKKIAKNLFKSLGILLFLGGLTISCNKEFKNLLEDNITQPEYNTGSSKVLMILVDGLSGKALQEVEPPTLYKMSRNSLYTYSALSDFIEAPITEERAWTNIFLGVDANKHEAISEIDQANTEEYPTFIKRVKELNSTLKTAIITSEEKIHDSFGASADNNKLANNDSEVLSTTLSELKDSNTDLIISHYKEVKAIGEDVNYDVENEEYLSAINDFDSYVKDMVAAIESRETYKQEDWLVIISSTTGGGSYVDPNDQTHFGKENRNTFTYFYSPKFVRKYLAKPTSENIPFKGEALNFVYSMKNNVVLEDDLNFGNIEAGKSYTINFFYRSYHNGRMNWAALLGKRPFADHSGGAGWSFFHSDDGVNFSSSVGDSNNQEVNILDGQWHVITAVLDRSLNKVTTYVDGIPAKSSANYGSSASNNSPLTFGYIDSFGNTSDPDYLISNFQFYDVAFTEEEVKELTGIVDVDSSHPHFSNLQGYWPGFDDVGTMTLKDKSGNGRDMKIKVDAIWNSFNNNVSFIRPNISGDFYKQVPNGVDLSFFVYQWLGVIPSKAWSLDGKSWTPDFMVNND